MKSRKWMWLTAMALLTAAAIPVQLAAQDSQDRSNKHHHYHFIDLGTFGGPGSSPTEFQQTLNKRGTLVGGADTPTPNPYPDCFNPFNLPVQCNVQHAFEWQDGVLTDLGTLPGGSGSSSFAYFITGNGLTVGGSENGAIDPFAGTPDFHAVLWRHGKIKDLGTLGGTSSLAVYANNRGQVVGFAQNAIPDSFSLVGLGTQTRAFLWQKGEMHDLLTLGGSDSFPQYVNERGQVAGVSYTSDVPDPNTGVPPLDPFLWENGVMRDLGNFGGTNGFLGPFIFGLNNRGKVVGVMALPGDQFNHAFLWDGERLSDLGTLGGNYSYATGINDAGEVIGSSWLAGDQVAHPFLWKNGAMTDLGIVAGDLCGLAESINARGQIVGTTQDARCNQYTHGFLWENGGPSVDLSTLIVPQSTTQLAGTFWINGRGEITGRDIPPGCDDVDNCGHAYLLIPCDENHPGVEGCDYSLVDAAAATRVSTPPVRQTAVSTTSRTPIPNLPANRRRFGKVAGASGVSQLSFSFPKR